MNKHSKAAEETDLEIDFGQIGVEAAAAGDLDTASLVFDTLPEARDRKDEAIQTAIKNGHHFVADVLRGVPVEPMAIFRYKCPTGYPTAHWPPMRSKPPGRQALVVA